MIVSTTPQGFQVEAPAAKPAPRAFPAPLQQFIDYPAQQVPSVFVGNAWLAYWDGPPKKRFPSGEQQDNLFPVQLVPTQYTPSAWTMYSDGPPHAPFWSDLQKVTVFEPMRDVVSTPQGFTAIYPELFVKKFPAALQQFEPWPKQYVASITPQGWWTIAPDRLRQKSLLGAHLHQDNLFPVQQVASPFVANGWSAYWDGPRHWPFPALLQQWASWHPEPTASPVTPQGYEAIYPALFVKHFSPSLGRDVQQPDAVYAGGSPFPEGWRVEAGQTSIPRAKAPYLEIWPTSYSASITPQGFWSMAPDYLHTKPFPAGLQRDNIFPSQQVPTLLVPTGWATYFDGPPKLPFAGKLQQYEIWPKQNVASITPQGFWVSAPDRVVVRPFPSTEQMDNLPPVQPVPTQFYAEAWSIAWDGPARDRLLINQDQAIVSNPTGPVFWGFVVTVPDIIKARLFPRDSQNTSISPAILAATGFAAIEPQLARKQRAAVYELVWPNSDQNAKTVNARPYWSSIDWHFRVIRPAPPDFPRPIMRTLFKIGISPTLLGGTGKPTLKGTDGQAGLMGTDGKPALSGIDGQAMLLGTDGKPTIKGGA